MLSMLIAPAMLLQIERGAELPRRGALGGQFSNLTAEARKSLALPPGPGIKLDRVIAGQTMERAGARAGDILLELNGKPISASSDVAPSLTKVFAGAEINLKLLREGKEILLKAKLVERPRQKEDGFKVVYDQVVSKGKRIRVISTYPADGKAYPTVFFIGGIGAYSLDGDFTGIAYGNVLGPIAKAGYATVRIDKPGLGDSEGPGYTDLAFGDELDAYIQAMNLAKTFRWVDKTKIAIFGHSMGGVFGPLTAEKSPVAAIAVSGTISKTWTEYWVENTRRQSKLGGATAAQLDKQARDISALCHYMFHLGMSPAQIKKERPELASVVDGSTPDGKTMSGVGIPFFQELARTDLGGTWEKIDAKVLALWGESEFISTRYDHEFIAEIVNRKHPGWGEFKPLPESDHAWFKVKDAAESQAKWGRGAPFNPSIIDALLDWLKRVLG